MKEKKLTGLFLLMLLCSVASLAQGQKPNFSGKWQLSFKESKLLESHQNGFENGTIKNIKVLVKHYSSKLIITELITPDKSVSNKNITNTFQYIIDGRIRLMDQKDRLGNLFGGFYQALWIQKKLVIKLFSEDKKNLKGASIGSIEFSQSGNKKTIILSSNDTEQVSLYSQKTATSKMIFNFLNK